MGDIRNQLIKAVKENHGIVSSEWINLEDQSIIQLILETFANADKKKILDATLDKPKSVTEILDICKMPPTSGYRKIKSLIDDNLLINNGPFLTNRGRPIGKYFSVLENIKINIDRGKLTVKVRFAKKLPYELHSKDME